LLRIYNLFELTNQKKIYTVDMRNHGDSQPYTQNMSYTDMGNDLRNFIDKIVLEKDQCDPNSVTLMGHSMGGKKK
jgi:pimeloyl-ACP methyl ester carboxylesterase